MTRTEAHLDAVLRHLGAAYYDSLQGRATRAEVARAVNTVAERLNQQEQPQAPAGQHAVPGQAARSRGRRDPGGWSRRVGDVMTTRVITADRATPYKEIARLLAEQRISGLPVLKPDREVAGVVTEADLLAGQRKTARRLRARSGARWTRRHRHPALTAGELMTAPAITIGPHATIPAAARLMDARHLRVLPVVDERNRLLGVLSRHDLLSVFLRPDSAIAADVRQVLQEILLAEPGEAEVTVRDGVVTLTGALDPEAGEHGDLMPVAIRLMWDVDGVVDVVDHLGEARGAAPAPPS
jgi:CBS domain-containing protein